MPPGASCAPFERITTVPATCRFLAKSLLARLSQRPRVKSGNSYGVPRAATGGFTQRRRRAQRSRVINIYVARQTTLLGNPSDGNSLHSTCRRDRWFCVPSHLFVSEADVRTFSQKLKSPSPIEADSAVRHANSTLSEHGRKSFETQGNHGFDASGAMRGHNGREECSKAKNGRDCSKDRRIPRRDTV